MPPLTLSQMVCMQSAAQSFESSPAPILKAPIANDSPQHRLAPKIKRTPCFFDHTVPSCCILSDMVQTEASADGSEWDRRTAACPLCCGDEMRHTYYLRNVIQPDGTPGKFHAELEALADEKMVTAW